MNNSICNTGVAGQSWLCTHTQQGWETTPPPTPARHGQGLRSRHNAPFNQHHHLPSDSSVLLSYLLILVKVWIFTCNRAKRCFYLLFVKPESMSFRPPNTFVHRSSRVDFYRTALSVSAMTTWRQYFTYCTTLGHLASKFLKVTAPYSIKGVFRVIWFQAM